MSTTALFLLEKKLSNYKTNLILICVSRQIVVVYLVRELQWWNLRCTVSRLTFTLLLLWLQNFPSLVRSYHP